MNTPRTSRHPAGSTRHLYVVRSPHDAPHDAPPGHAAPESALLSELAGFVGGLDVLWALDERPLPDESFDWSAVDERDLPFVTEVLALADRYCEDVLDDEYRTIVRRILARVAGRDCGPLRRSANASRCAAGLLWLAGQGSGAFGRRGTRSCHHLWTWFEVSNASDRGRALRDAAGLDAAPAARNPWFGELPLGDATLLHSEFRGKLIAFRNLFAGAERGRRSSPPPRFGGSRPA